MVSLEPDAHLRLDEGTFQRDVLAGRLLMPAIVERWYRLAA
jgi:hypothetical protein